MSVDCHAPDAVRAHMLLSSQDLFYIVASLVLVWLAVFLCWVLYRLRELLTETLRTMQEVNQKIATIDEWIESLRERTASSMAILSMIGQTLKTGIGVFRPKSKHASSSSTKTRKGHVEEQEG